jgi:DNA-directed RNA polymerase subunit RPC12/RpoP
LVDDDKVDLALIVSRTISGGYSGETVYPLNWAYEHARLVCKPDSNWLTASNQESTAAVPLIPTAVAPTTGPGPASTATKAEFAQPASLIQSELPAGLRKIVCPHCSQAYSIPRDKLTDLPRGATCRACGNRFTIHPE